MKGETTTQCCVIIPAFREAGRIGPVVLAVRRHCQDVVVIDDGSTDGTGDEAQRAGAHVIRHPVNRGKGIALNTGFRYIREQGFECVITMDADGQHAPDEIPAFIEAHRRTGSPVILGNRMEHAERMPLVRRLVNTFMSWWVSRKMGQCVPDTQVGFRLYRSDVIPDVPETSGRFAAESEILLLLAAQGVTMVSIPIQTIYRDEKSKINPVTDTLRFFSMLWRYDKRSERKARDADG